MKMLEGNFFSPLFVVLLNNCSTFVTETVSSELVVTFLNPLLE